MESNFHMGNLHMGLRFLLNVFGHIFKDACIEILANFDMKWNLTITEKIMILYPGIILEAKN